MSTSISFKAKSLAVAISSVILVACGGSSSKNNTPSPQPATTVEGRAVDGPLAGSTVVFADCNNQTATTDANGYFNFPAGCTQSAISVTGGTDTTLNIAFTGTLQAPAVSAAPGANKIVVTPITTLIAAAGGADQAAALAKALGLDGVDLLKVDPLSSQALYAKTVAAQQLIEEIQQTILSLGGNISAADANAAAIKALASALSSTNVTDPTKALQDPAVIASAIAGSLEQVKNDLPADIQANLSNVKENLGSLTAKAIAENIQSVESSITGLTNFGSGNLEAIKQATATILDAKDSAVTEKLVDALSSVLTSSPADVGTSLATIGAAAATGGSNASATIAAALTEITTNTGVTIPGAADLADTLADPDAFFANYVKLGGFNVQGTSYSVAQLANSLTTPINVPKLDSLALNISANGQYKGYPETFAAVLKLDNTRQNIVISVDKLETSYDDLGALNYAVIPTGAIVQSTSSLSNLTTNITVNQPIDVRNGSNIALNTTILAQLMPAISTQLTSINLSGDTVTATAILVPQSAIVAVDGASKLVVANKFELANKVGSGVTAKFKIAQ